MSDQRIPIPDPSGEEYVRALVVALNGIGEAINRLADVYLYVNDPEGEEGPAPTNLPEGFRGMR